MTDGIMGMVVFFGVGAAVAVLLWLEDLFPIERDQPRAEIICNYKLVASTSS
jgi:hypothetical protein